MTPGTIDDQGRLKIIDGSNPPVELKRTASADGTVGTGTVAAPVKVQGFASTTLYERGMTWDGTNHLIEIPSAGTWGIKMQVAWEANASGERIAHISKNSSGVYDLTETIARANTHDAGATEFVHTVVFEGRLAALDEIEFWVGQNSGVSLDLQGALGESDFWITARKLADV